MEFNKVFQHTEFLTKGIPMVKAAEMAQLHGFVLISNPRGLRVLDRGAPSL